MIKFEIMLSYSTEGPNRKKVEGLFKSFQEDMVDCLGEPKLHGTMLHIIDIEPPAKSKESPQTAKRSTERSTTNSAMPKLPLYRKEARQGAIDFAKKPIYDSYNTVEQSAFSLGARCMYRYLERQLSA